MLLSPISSSIFSPTLRITPSRTFDAQISSKLQESRPDGSASEAGAEGPRKYLIGGNWKCNGTWDENAERVTVFNGAGAIPANVEVALCVPDINIPQLLADLRKDIAVGAQNCGVNAGNGAFTGEVGSHQLKALGVTWVIIGHSERREGFGMAGETDELCAQKCKVAIDNGLKVMFVSYWCIFLGAKIAKNLSSFFWSKVLVAFQRRDHTKGNQSRIATHRMNPVIALVSH